MATWHHNQEDKNLIPDEVPLNCPFCGENSTCTDTEQYGEVATDGTITWDAYTWCHDCGARGPSVWSYVAWDGSSFYLDTDDELEVVNYAIRLWNKRV